MKWPRCENQVLDEKDRDGVVVDFCRHCRGIWLDRGELERLIAPELDEEQQRSAVKA
jgi:Zn-finger nucleic acid-binding protein